MQITFKNSGKPRKIEAHGTIEELLRKLGINTESVLVKRNGSFVPFEDRIRDRDEIEVIKITSSG